MDRRKFIGWSLVGLTALLAGQKCSKEPAYTGIVDVGVGKFFSVPGTDLVGVVEKSFDSSTLAGKLIVVNGKERKNLEQGIRFLEVGKIKTDGSKIYEKAKDKRLIDSDFPSEKVMNEDEYLSPKNFTYTNENAWKKLKKIKLTGTFSSDYQFIHILDEKDGKTNEIRVEGMYDWVEYKLKSRFYEKKYKGKEGVRVMFSIYATIKDTVDAKERLRTRELFTADVNYILPERITEEFLVSGEKKSKKSQ